MSFVSREISFDRRPSVALSALGSEHKQATSTDRDPSLKAAWGGVAKKVADEERQAMETKSKYQCAVSRRRYVGDADLLAEGHQKIVQNLIQDKAK